MPNRQAMPPNVNGRLIMSAIRRLGGSIGLTAVQIRNYLQTEKQIVCDTASIKLYLKNAVECGKLSQLKGKYKIKEEIAEHRSSGGSRGYKRKRTPKRSGPETERRRRSGTRRRSKKTAAEDVKLSDSRRDQRSKKTATENGKLSVSRLIQRSMETATEEAELSESRHNQRSKKAETKTKLQKKSAAKAELQKKAATEASAERLIDAEPWRAVFI